MPETNPLRVDTPHPVTSPFTQRSRAASVASSPESSDAEAAPPRRRASAGAPPSRMARGRSQPLPPAELLRPTPPAPPPLRQMLPRQAAGAPGDEDLRRMSLVGIGQDEKNFIVEYSMVKLLSQHNYQAVALFCAMAAETYLSGVDSSPHDFERAADLVDRTVVRARRKWLDKLLAKNGGGKWCGCLPRRRRS